MTEKDAMTIPANARRDQPPPWLDTETMCWHLCISDRTLDNWCDAGILPPARKRGGKLMWKWAEVDQYLTDGGRMGGPQPGSIADGVRKELEARDRARNWQ